MLLMNIKNFLILLKKYNCSRLLKCFMHMTKNILKRSFFMKPPVEAARQMLGKYIVHLGDGSKTSGMIVETEAYTGPDDKASHSYGWKKTERNRAMYLQGGHIYIYLVYGMYWQFNLTVGAEGIPQCVLIRAVEPSEGIGGMMERRKTRKVLNLASGPGKFCQAFGFNRTFYGLDITKPNLSKETLPGVYLEDRGEIIQKARISSAKRIGIGYAGKWADKLLRFYINSSMYVS